MESAVICLTFLRSLACLWVIYVPPGDQYRKQRNARKLVVVRLGDAYRCMDIGAAYFSGQVPGPPLLVGSDDWRRRAKRSQPSSLLLEDAGEVFLSCFPYWPGPWAGVTLTCHRTDDVYRNSQLLQRQTR